jgi:hypothetical protein
MRWVPASPHVGPVWGYLWELRSHPPPGSQTQATTAASPRMAVAGLCEPGPDALGAREPTCWPGLGLSLGATQSPASGVTDPGYSGGFAACKVGAASGFWRGVTRRLRGGAVVPPPRASCVARAIRDRRHCRPRSRSQRATRSACPASSARECSPPLFAYHRG